MRYYRHKTVLVLLVVSLLSLLGGFCVFQTNPDNPADSAIAETHLGNLLVAADTCGEEGVAEKKPIQTSPTPANQNQKSLLPCCLDNNHNGLTGIVQSIQSGPSVSMFFLLQPQITIPASQIFIMGNFVLPSFTLASIKTTVLLL